MKKFAFLIANARFRLIFAALFALSAQGKGGALNK